MHACAGLIHTHTLSLSIPFARLTAAHLCLRFSGCACQVSGADVATALKQFANVVAVQMVEDVLYEDGRHIGRGVVQFKQRRDAAMAMDALQHNMVVLPPGMVPISLELHTDELRAGTCGQARVLHAALPGSTLRSTAAAHPLHRGHHG